MQNSMLMAIRLFAALAIIVLVLLSAAYVMGVLPEEMVKKTFVKVMALIGIFTTGSLGLIFVLGGGKKINNKANS